jgi:CRISPR-associated protein Cmr5
MNALRDQLRARHAYASVATVPPRDRDDYRIAVNSFGAHVMRTGLCAAIAWLQRADTSGAELFLTHLDAAGIRGLAGPVDGRKPEDFARKVHAADAANYMIATRDTLALVVWFRRAVQASRGADRQDGAR